MDLSFLHPANAFVAISVIPSGRITSSRSRHFSNKLSDILSILALITILFKEEFLNTDELIVLTVSGISISLICLLPSNALVRIVSTSCGMVANPAPIMSDPKLSIMMLDPFGDLSNVLFELTEIVLRFSRPLKAELTYASLKVDGIEMLSSCLQSANASSPTPTSDSGITKSTSPLPLNAFESINVKLCGKSICFKAPVFSNALEPIL